MWVDTSLCGTQTSGCHPRPPTATKALRSQSLPLPGRQRQMSVHHNRRWRWQFARRTPWPPSHEGFWRRILLGKKARPHGPNVPFQPEHFLCPSFVTLWSEPFSEILSFSVQYSGPPRDGECWKLKVPPSRGGADNEIYSLHWAILELGWGLQEATWPRGFQPRLYLRIRLGALRKYRWPAPTQNQSKLNQQSRTWPCVCFYKLPGDSAVH